MRPPYASRPGSSPLDHVAEDVDHLLGAARGRLGGAVDLLQGVVELGVVEGDDRLAEGGRVAGVEGGVPLAVFVAEADDDDVGVADQRLGADRVDAGALVVAPEGLALLAEGAGAGVVGGGVVGDRRRELDRQAGLARPRPRSARASRSGSPPRGRPARCARPSVS